MEGHLPEKTCRTCLRESDELTSLYAKDADNGPTILEKLRFCASMEVLMSERTPSNACSECVRCIVEYYDFKRRCEFSENTLQNLYSAPLEYTLPKVEIEEVYIKEEPDDDSKWMPCLDEKEEVDGNTTQKERRNGEEDDQSESQLNSCPLCGERFKSTEEQSTHEQICRVKDGTDKKSSHGQLDDLKEKYSCDKQCTKYICDTCGKAYRSKARLRVHIEENHASEQKVYECKVCGKTYNFYQSLSQHKKTHNASDVRVKCDRCERTFLNKARLAQHVRRTHEKSHACDECDKRFARHLDLQKHKAVHVREMAKRYKCKICEKRFSTEAAVAFHLETQHRGGGKQYKCDVCGMEFYNRFHLAAHYSGHTGVKPYRCDGCGIGYNYKKNLTQHEKKCASLLELAQK